MYRGDDVDSDDEYGLEEQQAQRAETAWKKYQSKVEGEAASGASQRNDTAVWIYSTGSTGVSKRLHQVTCKTCGMTPIVGPRFASVASHPETQEMSHYSLCEDCVSQDHHDTVVLRLDKPQDLDTDAAEWAVVSAPSNLPCWTCVTGRAATAGSRLTNSAIDCLRAQSRQQRRHQGQAKLSAALIGALKAGTGHNYDVMEEQSQDNNRIIMLKRHGLTKQVSTQCNGTHNPPLFVTF